MTEDEPPPSAETKAKKEKNMSPNIVIQPKPKLSKAERRALQEQQRAAKAAGAGGGGVVTKKGSEDAKNPPSHLPQHHAKPAEPPTTTISSKSKPPVEVIASKEYSGAFTAPDVAAVRKSTNTAAFVSHLAPYQDPAVLFDTGAVLKHKINRSASSSSSQNSLHPAVVELGYQYATGAIRGGNARCRAMLECYTVVLSDFSPPSPDTTADLRYAVEHAVLKPAFTFWTEDCRPHSVTMGNAFSFLKMAVNSLDRDLQWDDMLSTVLETVSKYVREHIDYAVSAIAETACTKLLHDAGEVVLTYGHSEAVSAVLQQAAASGKQFRVIVVDSKPLLEGRILLQTLLDADVDCCYIHLHAVTYVLSTVTKVLLGAAALQSDGSVTGRVGTAVAAMAAHVSNIPVLVCAETYKISNRVQLEGITNNELGPPCAAADEGGSSGVKRLNLLYDLTPAAYVSGIVTELGIVPPSSVAVLLREMNQPLDMKR